MRTVSHLPIRLRLTSFGFKNAVPRTLTVDASPMRSVVRKA
jgi:hypothetical protein